MLPRSSYDWWLLSLKARRRYLEAGKWLEPIVLFLVGLWALKELL